MHDGCLEFKYRYSPRYRTTNPWPPLGTTPISTMPYEHTSLTSAQTATIQLLVSQVARAFFDPPYVVILERLMTTRDLWGEMELTHAVGLGPAKKELNKFMVGMLKQRLVKRFVAYHPACLGV
jgi:hypothetical protein